MLFHSRSGLRSVLEGFLVKRDTLPAGIQLTIRSEKIKQNKTKKQKQKQKQKTLENHDIKQRHVRKNY